MDDAKQTLTLAPDARQAPVLGMIGPYRLVEFLGRGATGIVYRAVDPDQAEIALKVMTASPLVSQEEVTRFLREAETAKRLRKHPNIITVYDTGQDGSQYYIAMDLVPGGRTLQEVIGTGLTIRAALDYAIPVGQALAYAHRQGILHRDLKPANLLLNEFDQPLLADFGLAKALDAPHLTLTGTVMGTPCYMSPEQCGLGDGEITRQSDIYTFGVVVYELLTGHLPYPITSEMGLPEIFMLVRDCEPRPPRQWRKEIGRNLEAVLLRLLDKERPLRYKEMDQVCADLEACRDGRPVSVRRLSPAERWEKWLRRHLPLALTATTALALGAGLYFGWFAPKLQRQRHAKQQADVNALAARHQAARLEEELEMLKHPGTIRDQADRSAGAVLLLQARQLLAHEQRPEAAAQYLAAAAWAEAHAHRGILLESRNSLARIALANGDYAQAAVAFQAVADAYGASTLSGSLARFEAGVAYWCQGELVAADLAWRELTRISRDDRRHGIDSPPANAYLAELAKRMLDRKKHADPERVMASGPPILRGLGYWVLAQTVTDAAKSREFMTQAVIHRGIFNWINQEKKHESAQ